MADVSIDEGRVRHIFRDSPGHFRDDTVMHHQILIDVASKADNFRGTDEFGTGWFTETQPDGT